MRPIKLTVSAFGPYADLTEIELNKLGIKGLYLITGDTGAGKTTIFDAITYALFGEASGGVRDINMFRSKYASPETPTFVELDFEYAGKIYYVRRNPDYERLSRRGEGVTLQKGDAQLRLNDGRVITKIKEVNSAIKDILGIDRSQFTQIVMIAQGEFLKLILASTEERQKIFREIFATKYYQILQLKLKDESIQIGRTCEDLRNSVKQYIDGAICRPDDVCEIELSKAKAGTLPTAEIIELIYKIISQDKSEKELRSFDLATIEKNLSEIATTLGKAEENEKAKTALVETKIARDEKIILQKQSLEKLDIEKAKIPLIESLSGTIVTAKNELSKYDELDMLNNQISEKQLISRETKEKQIKQIQNISKHQDDFTAQKAELETLKNSGVLYSETKQRLDALNSKKENIDNVNKDYYETKALFLKTQSEINDLTIKKSQLFDLHLKQTSRLDTCKLEFDSLSNISVINSELKQQSEKLIANLSESNELKTDLSKFIELLSDKNHILLQQKTIETDLKEQIKTTEDKLIEQRLCAEELEDIELINSRLIQKNIELLAKKKIIAEIKDGLTEIIELKTTLTKAQSEYEASSLKSSNINTIYEQKYKAYLDEQAGIIAGSLIEGEKCPVCGSISHPELATISLDAPSKDELDKLKQNAEIENSKTMKASEVASSINVKLVGKKEFIVKMALSVIGDCDFNNIEELLNTTFNELKINEISINKEISESEEKIKLKNVNALEIKTNESILKDKTADLNKAQNYISSISAEMLTLESSNKESIIKRANVLFGECEFEKIDEKLIEHIGDLKIKEANLNNEIANALEMLQKYESLTKEIPLQQDKIKQTIDEIHDNEIAISKKVVEIKNYEEKLKRFIESLKTIISLENLTPNIENHENSEKLFYKNGEEYLDENISNNRQERFKVINQEIDSLINADKDFAELENLNVAANTIFITIEYMSECIKSCFAENERRFSNELILTENNYNRFSELEQMIPVSEEQIKQQNLQLIKTNELLLTTETEMNSLIENAKKIKSALKHETKVQAESDIFKLEQEMESLRKSLEDAETDYQNTTSSLKELEGKISAFEEQLKGAIDADANSLIEQSNELIIKKKEISDIISAITTRLDRNNEALNGIEKQSEILIQTENRHSWVKSLSNTANGNVSGKEKIMLETYIQMTYFDRIIARANTRFMIMSSGQYELKRKMEADNNRSQSGLELDVIDHYNGSERSVKTLSGGESFKASLSLALGLSDEIQSSCGGIKLDTMFVDEGFGSLDEESLKQAINTLAGLTEGNRLIGIISHVTELKEKIDKQIVVKKAKAGGSFIEIIS